MALKNHQYEAIMRAYDLRQSMNKHKQNKRIEEVREEIPEIVDIERQISTISIGQAKKLIAGDSNALAELHEQLSQLAERKKQLLVDNGFDIHFMDPIYICTDCKDTGFINNEKCHCFKQASIDLLYAQSNLQEILELENFNTFRLDYYSDQKTDPVTGLTSHQAITRAVEESKDFIRKFSYDYQNLLFYGSTGIGKTFLTHCIAKELLESAYSVLYFSASQLFDALAQTTFSKSDNASVDTRGNIYSCDLLIIDDLGTELINTFVASSLFTCLDERELRKKPTIISTNLSLQSIRDVYSERIFSRLSSRYKIIKLFGDDIRIQKKLQQNTWRS